VAGGLLFCSVEEVREGTKAGSKSEVEEEEGEVREGVVKLLE